MEFSLKAPKTPFDIPGKPRDVATVRLNCAAKDQLAKLEYDGSEELVHEIERKLLGCYGFRGRFIERETTPMDLEIAMSSAPMAEFEPELTRPLQG